MALFFYSGVKDLCSGRNFTLDAKDNTENGALCAIKDNLPVGGIYACPAGTKYVSSHRVHSHRRQS